MTPPPTTPGSLCWVLPAWERGMVVAFDPQGTTVLVAYCDHERGKPVGVFPATAADFNGRSPSTYTRRDPTYTRRDPKHGQGQVDTASCPSYFNVEWVSAGQVSYMPPVDPKERTSQTNDAYEPLDAVLRGVPALTEELWETKARLYGEHGDDALFSLPNLQGLGLKHKWYYRGTYWERPIMLPTTNPKQPMSGRLLVERGPLNTVGWAWWVLGATGHTPYSQGNAKYAVEGMAQAEAALLSHDVKVTRSVTTTSALRV